MLVPLPLTEMAPSPTAPNASPGCGLARLTIIEVKFAPIGLVTVASAAMTTGPEFVQVADVPALTIGGSSRLASATIEPVALASKSWIGSLSIGTLNGNEIGITR